MIRIFFVLIALLSSVITYAQSKVTLREDGTILVNGIPFFPVGIYNQRSAEGLSQDIINCYKAGFNTVHLKNPQSTAILDEAYAMGMYVWIESDAVNQSGYFEYINQFKNHPALLGWSIADDVHAPYANCSVSCLEYRNEMVKSFDPDHLTFSTGFRASEYYGDYAPYIGITDLNGLYAYPVGNGTLGLNQVDYDLSWERSFGKPIMSIPQAFKWSFSTLVPTATQYRNMVYQSIINNPKAYLPYVWYDDDNYLLKYKSLYYEVKAINNELKGTALIPAIINGNYTRCITGVSPASKGVKAAAWDYNGDTYVVAVNTANSIKSANIQLPINNYIRANQIFTRLPNTLSLNNNSLTGTMGKYEVQIYKISKADGTVNTINKEYINKINLYPNPASDLVNLNFNILNEGDYEIKVIDYTGKILINALKKHYILGNFNEQIDLSSLKNGQYFIQIMSRNSAIVKNVIIKK